MNPGKFLIVVGAVFMAIGALWIAVGKYLPVGHLPGDILIQREGFTLYAPITSGLLLSLLLSLAWGVYQSLAR